MAYDDREASMQDGAPVELYTFRVYGTNYYYTSAASDQEKLSVTFLAELLRRGPIEQNDETPRNQLDIECSLNFPILDFYESAPPSDVILLTIQRFHRGDAEVRTIWKGRVLNATREGDTGKITCENKYTSIKQTGLRRLYGAACPHVLYGPACRAVEATFRIETTLDGVSGIELDASILATYDDGRFAGGMLTYEPTPGRIERRGIKSHVGTRIEITHPIPGLEALATVQLSPGCKHNRPDCNDFFHNIENHGGFDYVPKQNPMGNSSVF